MKFNKTKFLTLPMLIGILISLQFASAATTQHFLNPSFDSGSSYWTSSGITFSGGDAYPSGSSGYLYQSGFNIQTNDVLYIAAYGYQAVCHSGPCAELTVTVYYSSGSETFLLEWEGQGSDSIGSDVIDPNKVVTKVRYDLEDGVELFSVALVTSSGGPY